MNQNIIEIPFGTSIDNEKTAIQIHIPSRTHCMITGDPGSGKTTLVKAIIDSVVKNYDKSQVVVWTDFSLEQMEESQKESVVEVCPSGLSHIERQTVLINRLYEEAQNRIEIMSRERVCLFNRLDSLPLLIAVIDDFLPLTQSEYDPFFAEKFENILRMSHVVGISLICTTQLPISRFRGVTQVMAAMFNVNIALRSSCEVIYETLSINPAEVSEKDKEAIERVSSGKAGEFVFYNRYGSDAIVTGRIRL